MGEAVTSQIRDELLIMGVQARGFITRLIQTFFFNILFCNCARCEQYYDICHILQYLHFSAKIKFAKLPNCSFKNQTSFVDTRVQRDERKMNLSSIGSPGPPRMQLDRNWGFTSWGKGNPILSELNNLSTDVVEREGTFGNNFLLSRGTADQPKIDRLHLVTLATSARFSH